MFHEVYSPSLFFSFLSLATFGPFPIYGTQQPEEFGCIATLAKERVARVLCLVVVVVAAVDGEHIRGTTSDLL